MELSSMGIRVAFLWLLIGCQGVANQPPAAAPSVAVAPANEESGQPEAGLAAPSQGPAREPMLARLEGVWGWTEGSSTCRENPHAIRFSDDNLVMFMKKAHPRPNLQTGVLEDEYVYDIESIMPDRVLMRMRGEERRTPSGDLVEWELVVRAADTYCWRRTDWKADACTAANVRCSPDSAQQGDSD